MATDKEKWRNWQKCRLTSVHGTLSSILLNLPDSQSLTDWEKGALLELRRNVCTTLAQWNTSTNKILSK